MILFDDIGSMAMTMTESYFSPVTSRKEGFWHQATVAELGFNLKFRSEFFSVVWGNESLHLKTYGNLCHTTTSGTQDQERFL